MPVYKLLDEMPYEELSGWFDYFSQRPVGWRDDDRTAKLLQAQGVKEQSHKLFPSLKAIYFKESKDGDFDVNKFKASGIFSKMLTAKGGDKLSL
jgi:hypothetical protein